MFGHNHVRRIVSDRASTSGDLLQFVHFTVGNAKISGGGWSYLFESKLRG